MTKILSGYKQKDKFWERRIHLPDLSGVKTNVRIYLYIKKGKVR